MKKSNPWWWSKMASPDSSLTSGLMVMDYFLSECGTVDPVPEMDDRVFGPSDDIWKKFEVDFLPTPPRSPSRQCSDDEDDYMCANFEPKVNLVSDLLDWGQCPQSTTGLKNDLLHDCMWSGLCTDNCKRGHTKSLTPTADSLCDSLSVSVEDSRPSVTNCGLSGAAVSPALPVDPSTMLPYTPLSDHSYHNQQQVTAVQYSQPRTPPICDTPSDTEDDEIDVVTLPTPAVFTVKSEPTEVNAIKCSVSDVSSSAPTPAKAASRRPPGRQPTVPPLRVVIPASVLLTSKHKDRRGGGGSGRKRYHHSHHHNHHKRPKAESTSSASSSASSSSSNGGWVRRHYKRRFSSHNHTNRTVSCSSDSEDCVEKRSMHNSMERKRRDDLRFAFQNLREHVPELASNPKAPKVLILNRAASYARQLSQTGAALEKTLRQETRRRQELQRKLMQLNKLK